MHGGATHAEEDDEAACEKMRGIAMLTCLALYAVGFSVLRTAVASGILEPMPARSVRQFLSEVRRPFWFNLYAFSCAVVLVIVWDLWAPPRRPER